jgi:hypothetical protein
MTYIVAYIRSNGYGAVAKFRHYEAAVATARMLRALGLVVEISYG